MSNDIQRSPIKMLCFGSTENDFVISELCYKGTILQRNYRKMTMKWPFSYYFFVKLHGKKGAQWLSGRVLDSRPRGHGFQPHWRHCLVVLEQDTFILA